MASRLALDALLKSLFPEVNIYFQPPEGWKLAYPCIVYKLDDLENQYASNRPYLQSTRYQLTLMLYDPDSADIQTLRDLPRCAFDRHFTADGLNQYVYNLYF